MTSEQSPSSSSKELELLEMVKRRIENLVKSNPNVSAWTTEDGELMLSYYRDGARTPPHSVKIDII